jgi:putative FmdB family regulatory protein
MPNYDYDCLKCGHAFEAFQSMKDDPLKSCPKCKKRSVKRRIGGGAGLIFKGTGFYITDYKNKKSPAESASSDKSTSTSTSTPASTTTDAKPSAPASKSTE